MRNMNASLSLDRKHLKGGLGSRNGRSTFQGRWTLTGTSTPTISRLISIPTILWLSGDVGDGNVLAVSLETR